jgi:hypothetical protein
LDWVEAIDLDRSGRRLAALSNNGPAQVFDLEDSSRPRPRLPQFDVRASDVSVSPDGRWVATGLVESPEKPAGEWVGVRIWDAVTGELVRELLPGEQPARVAFSPDGRWLVIGTVGGHGVYRYQDGSWEQERFIPREREGGAGSRVAFTPDGRVMALMTSRAVICLMDTTTWLPLARLQSPESDAVLLLGFTPDGGQLAVRAHEDGAVHLWDLRLIRGQLRAMGLDWDQADYPPVPPARPVRVEVDPAAAAFEQAWGAFIDGLNGIWHRRWDRAVAGFSRAIQLNPEFADAYTHRAAAYSAQGRWKEAIADANEAIRRQAGDAAPWNERAGAHAGLKQWAAAFED